jgi:hypothetical protein
MYLKIDFRNSTLTMGLQYQKQDKAKLLLFKWHYNKQALQKGTPAITNKLIIGVHYANQHIKMFTHHHQAIKKHLA